MKRKISIFLSFIIILTLIVSCTPKTPNNGGNEPEVPGQVEKPNPNEEPETPEVKSKEVTLYFANKKYVDSGDESIEKLISENRTIEYNDLTLEEAIVRELIVGPKDKDNLYTEIPENAKLLSVEVKDKIAYVDFASDGMNGGSLQETFTINQIVASLVQLDNVDKVQFLLDGKEAESLMGHFDIRYPFEKVTD